MKLQMIDPDRMEVPPRPLRLKVRRRATTPGGLILIARRLARRALRKLAAAWSWSSESQR
ncbi:MAG: hypothetical protein ACYDAL_07905 [Candidatus Dormibacteraceae bacterium]